MSNTTRINTKAIQEKSGIDRIPDQVMEAILDTIKYKCETLVQEAITKCEFAIRDAVQGTIVKYAEDTRFNWNAKELTIVVKFPEPKTK